MSISEHAHFALSITTDNGEHVLYASAEGSFQLPGSSRKLYAGPPPTIPCNHVHLYLTRMMRQLSLLIAEGTFTPCTSVQLGLSWLKNPEIPAECRVQTIMGTLKTQLQNGVWHAYVRKAWLPVLLPGSDPTYTPWEPPT